MLQRALSVGGGGGSLNPTIVKRDTLYGQSSGTCTIDISKDYLIIGGYKYNDNTNRQEVQYIHNGIVTSLTNNWGSTYVRLSTINGDTLSYGTQGSIGSFYFDFSIIQLN